MSWISNSENITILYMLVLQHGVFINRAQRTPCWQLDFFSWSSVWRSSLLYELPLEDWGILEYLALSGIWSDKKNAICKLLECLFSYLMSKLSITLLRFFPSAKWSQCWSSLWKIYCAWKRCMVVLFNNCSFQFENNVSELFSSTLNFCFMWCSLQLS